MKHLDKETVDKAMAEIGAGQFFTIAFEKADESVRVMDAQIGVRKYVKGGRKTINDETHQVVYERSNGEYRCFDKSKVVGLSYNGKQIGALQ